MGRRAVIIYSSRSGNTEKVASRFSSIFDREGWECDLLKVGRGNREDIASSLDLNSYDFVCVGSGVNAHAPYDEIIKLLRRFVLDGEGRVILRRRDDIISEPLPAPPGPDEIVGYHRKIALGPDSGKAVVFATYAGYEFGPKEAEPALQLLELDIEHLGFKCVGRFCCPGRYLDNPTPTTYHGDIRDRPNEKDLLKAELFLEETLEAIVDRANE